MAANTKAETDVSQATGGASAADVSASQQTAGAAGGSYSEQSHKMATDVNTEESISTYNQFAVQRALRNQDAFDNLTFQLMQNAIETANMISKQAVRHSDLAIDRQWNVNETDAYSTASIKAVADIIKSD